MFQDYALFPHRNVAQNVAFGLRMQGLPRSEIEPRVHEALERVNLGSFGQRKVTDLSGGEQQRVALARALVNKPSIVLADEPTGNLDSENSRIVLQMLRECNRELGQTVMMITHNPEAAEYGDRALHMRDGQVVPPEQDPQWTGHHEDKLAHP